MNYEAVEFWFSAGQWVFSLILAGSIWFNRKQAATVQRVERVESRLGKRVEDVEKDMVQVKTELRHLPSQQSMEKLSRDITAVTREMAETKGQMRIIGHTALLINDFLIQESRKEEARKREERRRQAEEACGVAPEE